MNINTKIHNDLQIVVDKMNGCETLLQTSSGATQELLAVVGFLEACQPRMVELVEAAAQGALSEHVLMECLDVNDRLTNILNDVDRRVDFTNVPEAGPATVNGTATTETMDSHAAQGHDDLLLMEDFDRGQAPDANQDAPNTAGLKTTGEDLDDLLDLNADDLKDLDLGGDAEATQGIAATKTEDEFDEFISSRQTS